MASGSTSADKDMWTDKVFISRQKEIRQLATDFETVMDRMVVNRPIALDPKLLAQEEEEEVEEQEQEVQAQEEEVSIHRRALLLMREIDLMRQDTQRLIVWFRPSATKSNPRLRNMKQCLEQLYTFLESLRIRAENLLAYD
jgi:hypothetical protein